MNFARFSFVTDRKKTKGMIVSSAPFIDNLNVVTDSNYNWFWITWSTDGMELAVGEGCEIGNRSLMTYTNTLALALSYAYVASGVGTSAADWIIPTNQYTAGHCFKLH